MTETIDPYADHSFVVVYGVDDTEVLNATDGHRRVETFATMDTSVDIWVADVIAVPSVSVASVRRIMEADFDVSTAQFETRKEALSIAASTCGFGDITPAASTAK